MEKDNVENLIDNIIEPSQSEKDRSQIDSLKSLNLLRFIDAQVNKATQIDDLKNDAKNELKRRLNEGKEDEVLTNVELIKLVEVLNKDDTDFSSNLMSSITELYKIKKDLDENERNPKKGNETITKEDLQQLKELAKIFKKLTTSEFPEIEEGEQTEEENE